MQSLYFEAYQFVKQLADELERVRQECRGIATKKFEVELYMVNSCHDFDSLTPQDFKNLFNVGSVIVTRLDEEFKFKKAWGLEELYEKGLVVSNFKRFRLSGFKSRYQGSLVRMYVYQILSDQLEGGETKSKALTGETDGSDLDHIEGQELFRLNRRRNSKEIVIE